MLKGYIKCCAINTGLPAGDHGKGKISFPGLH